MAHDLHCYDYVHQPYERVRESLREDPRRLFQCATAVAIARAKELRAQLHTPVGPLELATQVEIRVSSIEGACSPLNEPALRLMREWRAARAMESFPVMHTILRVYALTPTETQLELEGTYAPPPGAAGESVDAMFGLRIAEASMLRFIQEVAARLREELATDPLRPGGSRIRCAKAARSAVIAAADRGARRA